MEEAATRAGLMGSSDPGFSIHPDVLGLDDRNRLRSAMDGLPHRTRAGARHLMSEPCVAALARDPRLLALAAAELGAAATPYRATLFDKSSRANWLVTWHQDTALPLRSRREVPGWGPWSVKAGVLYAHAPARVLERIVALRVHLDDSCRDNGPLRVLPGTHTLGVLSSAEIRELTTRGRAHECLVARGGILVMRPLLVHASSKALTSAPRRVLHLEYAAGPALEGGLELAPA